MFELLGEVQSPGAENSSSRHNFDKTSIAGWFLYLFRDVERGDAFLRFHRGIDLVIEKQLDDFRAAAGRGFVERGAAEFAEGHRVRRRRRGWPWRFRVGSWRRRDGAASSRRCRARRVWHRP